MLARAPLLRRYRAYQEARARAPRSYLESISGSRDGGYRVFSRPARERGDLGESYGIPILGSPSPRTMEPLRVFPTLATLVNLLVLLLPPQFGIQSFLLDVIATGKNSCWAHVLPMPPRLCATRNRNVVSHSRSSSLRDISAVVLSADHR